MAQIYQTDYSVLDWHVIKSFFKMSIINQVVHSNGYQLLSKALMHYSFYSFLLKNSQVQFQLSFLHHLISSIHGFLCSPFFRTPSSL